MAWVPTPRASWRANLPPKASPSSTTNTTSSRRPRRCKRQSSKPNAEVHRRGEANPDFHNMGTTASALVLLPQGALVAHIGDSRVYRFRGNLLRQLTFDHSLVWEMERSGQVPNGVDVQKVVPKNVITRSLGPNPHVKIDFEGPFPVQVGDTFLLCSDGLTGKVDDEELGVILANVPPKEAAQVLVDLANLRGGPDNITVILVKVTSPQVTTAVAKADPLVIGAVGENSNEVNPALWVVTGVCFLAAVVMAVLGFPLPAVLAACGGMIALTIGILQQFGGISFLPSSEVELTGGKILGSGPHTKTEVHTGAPSVEKLATMVEDLRHAVARQNVDADWEELRIHAERADAAAQAGKHGQAVREYCSSVSFLMRQLREHANKQGTDSRVDLF